MDQSAHSFQVGDISVNIHGLHALLLYYDIKSTLLQEATMSRTSTQKISKLKQSDKFIVVILASKNCALQNISKIYNNNNKHIQRVN